MIKQSTNKAAPNGFSITEVTISIAVFYLILTITTALFGYSIKNIGRVERKQNEADLIDADVAKIHQINQQFSCTSISSCTVAQNSDSYPDEDSYIPDDYAENIATQAWLESQCNDGFGDDLAAYINNLTTTNLEKIGIARNADPSIPENSPHEYTVFWKESNGSPDQSTVRQITLRPTIASWC